MSSVPDSPPDVGAIIVAAGAGVRAGPGEPKQFRPIHGVPMLLRALRPFTSHPAIAHVVVTLPPVFAERPPEWLARLTGGRLTLVAGGVERADSVRAGLAALSDEVGIVLVHDAARPFASRLIVDAVIERARSGVGAVAGVPVSDTVKEADADHRVLRTVPRERLWRAQTPQAFPVAMLTDAYLRWPATAGVPTDDSVVCERAGYAVDVIPDSVQNLKITTADDFRVAEAVARDVR